MVLSQPPLGTLMNYQRYQKIIYSRAAGSRVPRISAAPKRHSQSWQPRKWALHVLTIVTL
uniref:Uncharacterized protein n=1 Tax=Arundo donax TaxID=35708 RepID=A0A0A9BH31_ARUDO